MASGKCVGEDPPLMKFNENRFPRAQTAAQMADTVPNTGRVAPPALPGARRTGCHGQYTQRGGVNHDLLHRPLDRAAEMVSHAARQELCAALPRATQSGKCVKTLSPDTRTDEKRTKTGA